MRNEPTHGDEWVPANSESFAARVFFLGITGMVIMILVMALIPEL